MSSIINKSRITSNPNLVSSTKLTNQNSASPKSILFNNSDFVDAAEKLLGIYKLGEVSHTEFGKLLTTLIKNISPGIKGASGADEAFNNVIRMLNILEAPQ